MPEVQEVFRMATQKVRPDPGFVDRQHDHRRKQERRRKIGAFVVVAAIGVAAITLILLTRPGETVPTPADTPPSAQPSDAAALPIEGLPTVRHVNGAGGVPFSLKVPTYGWERFGSISLNKSETGPQGAEAMIYWSSFPDGGYLDYFGHDSARPCDSLLSPPVGPSIADLANAVSTAPGTELVTGPSDVTLGGYPAKRIVLTVRRSVGCDPGFFFAWHDVMGGALWMTTPVATTMRVWIVDVDGTRLFVGAATLREASADLEQEVERIVGSIRFE